MKLFSRGVNLKTFFVYLRSKSLSTYRYVGHSCLVAIGENLKEVYSFCAERQVTLTTSAATLDCKSAAFDFTLHSRYSFPTAIVSLLRCTLMTFLIHALWSSSGLEIMVPGTRFHRNLSTIDGEKNIFMLHQKIWSLSFPTLKTWTNRFSPS